MGRISQYEQGQLASSAVGTPGVNLAAVDTSGIDLANTAAKAFGGVQDELNTTLKAQQAETQRLLREKEAEAKANAHAMQVLQDRVELTDHQYKMDNIAQSNRLMVKDHMAQDPTANPENSIPDFQALTQPVLSDYVNKIQNPRVKLEAQAHMNEVLKTESSKLEEEAHAQKTANAFSQVDSAKESLLQQAGYATSGKEIQAVLKKVDDLEVSAHLAIGAAKTPEYIRTAKSDIAKQYLDGLFARPGGSSQAAATIDSGIFKSILTGEDVKHYKDAAAAVVERQNRQDEHDLLMGQKHEATSIRSAYVNTEIQAPNKTPEQVIADKMALVKRAQANNDPVLAGIMVDSIKADAKEQDVKGRAAAAALAKKVKEEKQAYHLGPGAADYKNLQTEMKDTLERNSASLGGKNKAWFGVPDASHFMKDLDGIHQKAYQSWQKGGLTNEQYYHIEGSVKHLQNGLLQNKANPDLGKQLHQGLSHIFDFATHIGAPKKQVDALTGNTLNAYNSIYTNYLKTHGGKEPSAKVHTQMIEDAKHAGVLKSGE